MFDDLDLAAGCVSAIIAAGIVPAALEMMDGALASVVEDFCAAGYPAMPPRCCWSSSTGPADGVERAADQVRRTGLLHEARTVRAAADDAERDALWRGRKSAFGAVARILPGLLPPRHRGAPTACSECWRRSAPSPRATTSPCTTSSTPATATSTRSWSSTPVNRACRPCARGRRRDRRRVAGGGGVLSVSTASDSRSGTTWIACSPPSTWRTRTGFGTPSTPTASPTPKVLPSGSRCADLQAVPDGVWV